MYKQQEQSTMKDVVSVKLLDKVVNYINENEQIFYQPVPLKDTTFDLLLFKIITL